MSIITFTKLLDRRRKLIVLSFFIVFLILGICIFRDYGVSWDENYSRFFGVMAYKYAFEGDQRLHMYPDRYYGPIFEFVLYTLEKLFDLTDNPRQLYFMRHFCIFFSFYVGVYFFYLLCKKRFHSWKVGLLGALCLILSPRIFAHAFYNSKDLVFLSFFIIAVYSCHEFLINKTFYKAAIHALISAILIDIRILGILVPAMTLFLFIKDLVFHQQERGRFKQNAMNLLAYIVIMVSLTILFWPTLWSDPWREFLNAFESMRSFQWAGKVLFMGNEISAADLPWFYAPVWILISTPIFYSLIFFVGIFLLVIRFLKKPFRFLICEGMDLLLICWFFIPLCAVIIFHSVIYDGWRQLFFVYPAFLLIGLTGLIGGYQLVKSKLKGPTCRLICTIIIGVVIFNLTHILRIMINYHPYQNLYFNRLAGKNMKEVKQRFEFDYWGLSYRRALEFVLDHDDSSLIKVYVANDAGINNAFILSKEERSRLDFVDYPHQAKYFFSNYRHHQSEYKFLLEFFSINIDDAKVMVVYKM